MRSGNIFFVLSLTLLVGLAVWSCSDSTPTSPLTVQDQNFQAVQTEVNEFLDTAIAQVTNGLQLADVSVPFDTAIDVVFSPINPDSVNKTNNWLVIYSSNLATAFTAYRVDSLQFHKNGVVLDSAKGCDAISIRHHFSFDYTDMTGDYRNRQGYATFELTNLNTTTAVINGYRQGSVQSRSTVNGVVWNRTFDMEMTFATVAVPRANNGWQTGCPESGTITGTVTLTAAQGTNTPTESTWEYEIAFDSGVATATVTSGVYSRTYTKTICQ